MKSLRVNLLEATAMLQAVSGEISNCYPPTRYTHTLRCTVLEMAFQNNAF